MENDDDYDFHDYSYIKLKQDYENRPLFLSPDGYIFLETFSPLYRTAYQFLISIAEPIQRPLTVHKFVMSKYSLYTAMVLQYQPQDIILCLKELSKNREIPQTIIDYILQNTKNYGSARLFLDGQNYFLDIESKIWEQIKYDNPQIKNLICETEFSFDNIIKENKELKEIQNDLNIFFFKKTIKKQPQNESDDEDNNKDNFINQIINQKKKTNKSFKRIQITGDYFEITKSVINANVPLIQEYDFQKQDSFKYLQMDIQPKMKIRYYQEKALKNIFIEQKARSGLIILPYGAGKTIVGVIAIERIKQSTIVICDSDVSVDQWRDELERWTTISRNKIVRFTGRITDEWITRETDDPIILLTTYYMLSKKREKNQSQTSKKQQYIQTIQEKQWGVCIIDEVHKLPANTFQNVLKQYKFHFKLGLTATPYREDEKISNLFYMIGPKLYEENWHDLVKQGFLASPYCVEIRCNMAEYWKQQYDRKNDISQKRYFIGAQRELLHTSNPNKFNVLEFLIKIHEDRGDKILVFCDRPVVLEYYSKILKYPIVSGNVQQDERKTIYNLFKNTNQINTIFLSRVGDTAIDLPSANVGIQIGIHFKSRRQEVQRLGRIMRAKGNYDGQYNAFWYTLVSKCTDEVNYCLSRQKCLINQGFKYEVLDESDLPFRKQPQKFKWMNKINEQDYLYDILMSQEDKIDKKVSSSSSSGSDSENNVHNIQIQTKESNVLFSNLALYKEVIVKK
ncbi:hypothetical protein IMG5_077910 [Ichthyophthirius multifiliis]|uniref:DNA 3'-5' helicase n=1 Tax=Ichthyophthirius multifiliis TaxID=5932 RepID=G0QQE5_ICHMU|nr:hypothetical protein IMG5_077910 [Ichthyophthirius multifiliis]EGR32554.1 hypothetical protein IMG5_077910 [Ichthyophthirius multifiliis]|eukprot:XP_004036540.1 hypothetical protein IMG5_077910 [Ichthyophthirius multifiliis]